MINVNTGQKFPIYAIFSSTRKLLLASGYFKAFVFGTKKTNPQGIFVSHGWTMSDVNCQLILLILNTILMLSMWTKTHLNCFFFLQESKLLLQVLLGWFQRLKAEHKNWCFLGNVYFFPDDYTEKLVTWVICWWKEEKLIHGVHANQTWFLTQKHSVHIGPMWGLRFPEAHRSPLNILSFPVLGSTQKIPGHLSRQGTSATLNYIFLNVTALPAEGHSQMGFMFSVRSRMRSTSRKSDHMLCAFHYEAIK